MTPLCEVAREDATAASAAAVNDCLLADQEKVRAFLGPETEAKLWVRATVEISGAVRLGGELLFLVD